MSKENKAKLKEITVTLRITDEMDAQIEKVRVHMNASRNAGTNEVTKTEAIRGLIILGQEVIFRNQKKKVS